MNLIQESIVPLLWWIGQRLQEENRNFPKFPARLFYAASGEEWNTKEIQSQWSRCVNQDCDHHSQSAFYWERNCPRGQHSLIVGRTGGSPCCLGLIITSRAPPFLALINLASARKSISLI